MRKKIKNINFKDFNKLEKYIYKKLKTDRITYEILQVIKKFDIDNKTNKIAEGEFLKYWNIYKIRSPRINHHKIGFILVWKLKQDLKRK